MSVDLKSRKVARFRCHIDPMVGGLPKNAFDVADFKRKGGNLEAELTPAGVYVKYTKQKPGGGVDVEEHLIPYANVQSIKLETEPKKEAIIAAGSRVAQ